MKNRITFTVGGREYSAPEGTSWHEALLQLDGDRTQVLLVRQGSHLRELRHPVTAGETELVTNREAAGHKTYERSLCLMMMKAVADLEGEVKPYEITVHFIVSDGLYCTLNDPSKITPAFLEAVTQRMRELQQQAIPFTKKTVPTPDAIRYFEDRHMSDKVQLLRYRMSSRINLYDLDGYSDYYYGYMVFDTSCLKEFALTPYRDGFVLRMPPLGSEVLEEFRPDEKLFGIQNGSLDWGRSLGLLDVGDLNGIMVEGGAKDLILVQEAWHEKQIADIARDIASDSRRRIVMIAGPSSSGKTTFSHRLSTQLSVYGLRPHPIPVDDYFVNRVDTPKDENGEYDFECLEAIDIRQFNEDMRALLAGEKVQLPTYNFKTGCREYKGHELQMKENDILVIEGIHCLNDALSYSLPAENKYKIYISCLTQLNLDEHNRIATTDGRLLRRIVRDARTRGNTATDTIRMWPSVRRGEENHIFPFQESANVMFNSALLYELSVLKIYAQPLLFGVAPDSPEYAEAWRLLKFLDYFVPMAPEQIPMNSLVREFIGGSCYEV